MAYIANGAGTVGEVVNGSVDFLLGGLFREKKPGKGVRQMDLHANRAQRAALEILRDHLNEVWCGDAATRFADVPVPTGDLDG